jgi:capsular exopolysaccharide synthesis family protein
MKTKEYFAPLLKWWWLLLVAALVAGGTAFVTTRPLPSVYEANTTLVIGRLFSNLNPTADELFLSQQLALTYADIAMREPVRNATMAALGINDLPDYTARPLENGPFLQVSVTYTDPAIAQAVSIELSRQLIMLSPANMQETDPSGSSAFVQEQLKDVQDKIIRTKDEINKKQEDLATLTSAVQIAQTESELNALDTRLTSLQQIYANMQATMPQSARNQLSIYESAGLPVKPIGPNKLLIIALATLGGIFLAALAAYGLEALDTTVKTSEDVTRILDKPIIGRVSLMPTSGNKNWTYVSNEPLSGVTEDFRMLRTNLEFFAVDAPQRTLMLTSSSIGEGKSTISSNLAIMMAMDDNYKQIILVDADFRRPVLSDVLEIDQSVGLSDVISHNLPLADVLVPFPDNPRLKILPAGTVPPNPTELLISQRMDHVIAELAGMADKVIFDGPPVTVADASVLAKKVDGVLLVVRPGHSSRAAVAAMKEQMERVGANVLGIVLNTVRARTPYYSVQRQNKKPRGFKKNPEVGSETRIEGA